MIKNDNFNCCCYKDEITMHVNIIQEKRFAGTVILRPLLQKCANPCFLCIPCNLFDCLPDCNECGPESCKCGFNCSKFCSNEPNRCCCGICLKPNCCNINCDCDLDNCCKDNQNRCCCGICPSPGCCKEDPNKCCCGICSAPKCCQEDPNRYCCGLCPKNITDCKCCSGDSSLCNCSKCYGGNRSCFSIQSFEYYS